MTEIRDIGSFDRRPGKVLRAVDWLRMDPGSKLACDPAGSQPGNRIVICRTPGEAAELTERFGLIEGIARDG